MHFPACQPIQNRRRIHPIFMFLRWLHFQECLRLSGYFLMLSLVGEVTEGFTNGPHFGIICI